MVYDLARLSIGPVEKAHDFPGDEWRRVQRARGYRYVLVNGEVTIEDDKQTGCFSGRLLRGDRTQAELREEFCAPSVELDFNQTIRDPAGGKVAP